MTNYAAKVVMKQLDTLDDLRAQLSAVTKERDELREAVKRIAGNLDAAAARCRDDYERWDELILYRNLLLSAALQPPAEEQQT